LSVFLANPLDTYNSKLLSQHVAELGALQRTAILTAPEPRRAAMGELRFFIARQSSSWQRTVWKRTISLLFYSTGSDLAEGRGAGKTARPALGSF
jgi:hypothetical protein